MNRLPGLQPVVIRPSDGRPTIGTVRSRHRVHVIPALRAVGGRVLLRDWLAITIGRDIWCWRPLDEAELAHELCHVHQWERYGVSFLGAYALASIVAMTSRGHWYRDNAFEVAARRAALAVQGRQALRPDP
jgi:hypothetical protein